MPAVLITETARDDLAHLVSDHSLPHDTNDRVREILEPLEEFPSMGSPLEGRWAGSRFLLGPWSWMLLIYEHIETPDAVVVTTIQDARRANSATTSP